MGTRADFYTESDDGLVWQGSVALGGYPGGFDDLRAIEDEADFTRFMDRVSERVDFTHPEQGWPWPWDDSETTDFAYKFVNGHGLYVTKGSSWVKLDRLDDGENGRDYDGEPTDFPDMSDRANVTYGL